MQSPGAHLLFWGVLAAHSSVLGHASPNSLAVRTHPRLSFFHCISRNVKSATNTGDHVVYAMSDTAHPVDTAFTKALPKIELHAHLTGSISRECLHHIWESSKSQDPALNLEDPLAAIPTGKVDYDIKTYSTKSVLQDFQADGVVYLELRTTPRAMPAAGLSKADYVSTILDILKAHNKDTANSMRAFLILSIDRRNTIAEAQDVVDLVIKYQSKGVVGVDLCGDPAKGDVRIFADAFARAKAAGLKITLHFAETELSASDRELSTLLSWKPDRLGHVIHVKEEFRNLIEKENVGVELCLSCNVHAKLITGTYPDHHFGMWRHSSVPVALSTDDVGVFCSPLSQEYYLAAQHFVLGRQDIKALCEGAVESIFGGSEEKARLRRLTSEWGGWGF